MEAQELSPKLSHRNNRYTEALKDPPPQTETTTKAITSIVDEKTLELDKERFEIACLRQTIINEYEKKSGELLEYLKTMEVAFQEQRQEYVKREAGLRKINKELRKEIGQKLKLAQDADQVLLANSSRHPEEIRKLEKELDMLRAESTQHERNYKCEQSRAEELQKFIENLQLEIQKAQGLVLHRRKKIDETRKRMDAENQEFRRKAALGWLLGCLSELFLRLDPETGRDSIMKFVRRVQREIEAGNDVLGMPRKLELELEKIQREVRRLIGNSQTFSQPTPLRRGLTEPCTPTKASCEPRPEAVAPSCKFLGGTGRRRWRKCNEIVQFMDKPEEVMARPSTAPTSDTSPGRNGYSSCQRFVVNCTQDQHNQCDCRVTCHGPTVLDDRSLLDTDHLRDRGLYAGQVVNLRKASRRKTLARLRNMSSMLDEPMQASNKLGVQGMFKGLERHMTLMLSRKWKPPFRQSSILTMMVGLVSQLDGYAWSVEFCSWDSSLLRQFRFNN